SYEDLTYVVRDHVGIITLARPQVHNALRMRSYRELEDAVRSTQARVLVITGADRSFCSGDDVRELMAPGAPLPDQLRAPAITPAAAALLPTDVPVIAAVNGAALGGDGARTHGRHARGVRAGALRRAVRQARAL